MADFRPDFSRMCGVKNKIKNIEHLCSKHPLIEIDSEVYLKNHYVFMNFDINRRFDDSGLVVICEMTKSYGASSRKTVILMTVIVGFVLGLVVGVVIPLNLAGYHLPFVPKCREASHITNELSTNGTRLSPDLMLNKCESKNSTFVNGIFWSEFVESLLPVGYTHGDEKNWNAFVRKKTIVKVEKGCGRMQNRLLTFEDGTKACCRYRQNTDQIQGEIFSYFLGRLLNLRNVVPSTVVSVNSSDQRWWPIKSHLVSSHWTEDHPIVLTKYIEDLLPANIPLALRDLTGNSLTSGIRDKVSSKRPVILETLLKKQASGNKWRMEEWIKNEDDAVELAQWSDLIIFDYLTANLDRVVNNLYNLQWNPDMLSNPAHNLARISGSNLLVFLDNESGMLHGYRLLDKYEPYHSLLLNNLCVFRKSTVDALSALSLCSNPGSLISRGLPSPELLPPLPDNNGNILRIRIAEVLHQVISCAQRYHGSMG